MFDFKRILSFLKTILNFFIFSLGRRAFSTLTLHVLDENDSPPAFVHSKYSCSVSAAAKEGDAVLMVSATDEDQGNDSIFFKEKSVFELIF